MGPFDEELSDEDKAALAALEADNTAPPPEVDGEGEPAAVAAKPAPVTTDKTSDAPAEVQPVDDDAAFKAWLEQHKGKSPEEIAKLAFQQTKRADRVAFDHRRVTSQSAELAERARQALVTQRAGIATRRDEFAKQLENDPDAATKQLADHMLDAEERAAIAEVERLEHEARLDAAIGLAAKAIPDFQQRYLEIQQFGLEMNYAPEDIAGITDGRDVVTLYLAMLAGNLIKAGSLDIRGKLLSTIPPAVAATDPRLATPAPPKTMTGAPGRPADAVKSVEDQLADLLNLPDDEFAKIPEETLRRLTTA